MHNSASEQDQAKLYPINTRLFCALSPLSLWAESGWRRAVEISLAVAAESLVREKIYSPARRRNMAGRRAALVASASLAR